MWCVLVVASMAWGAARAGDVASAGAAGLRAETCVARGRWGMLLAASSLPCISNSSYVAPQRQVLPRETRERRLTLRTRGAKHHRRRART